MSSSIADSIRRGLEQAIAYANGTADARDFVLHYPRPRDSDDRREPPPETPYPRPR